MNHLCALQLLQMSDGYPHRTKKGGQICQKIFNATGVSQQFEDLVFQQQGRRIT